MTALVGWSDAAKAQLTGRLVRAAVFFRLDSDPIVRVWGGAGDFLVPVGGPETAAVLYTGMGELAELPVVSQLINGVAERVTFSVSGVFPQLLALAKADAGVIAGAACRLGFCVLDAELQRLSPIAWLWRGEADKVTVGSQPGELGPVCTVTLSVGSLFTRRKRPNLDLYTDAQQRLRSPDDAYCSNVASISQGVTKRFTPREK